MKSLWRKIGFIMAWSILTIGIVGAVVAAATMGSFYHFSQLFVPSLFFFTILMVYLEHTNNVEMRLDQTYRKNNNLPVLPDNAYTNLPISSSPAPQYQQPAPQYQQPAPQYQQPAPQYQQPAPQYQQPVPQSVPAPQPDPQPVPAPAAVCPNCGNALKPGAKFCPKCGNHIN